MGWVRKWWKTTRQIFLRSKFYESYPVLWVTLYPFIKGTGVTVLFVAHYHCISARFLSALVVQIKNMNRALWALHTVYIIFTQNPTPTPPNHFCLHVFFFLQTHPSSLPHDVFCLSGHPKALSLTRNILRTQAITHNNPKCTQINTYMDES